MPLRHNFFTAQKEAATPWSRLYFPEEASYHAVNSVLYKRLQETLGEQDRAIHEQKTQEIHTHNIAVNAEVLVAELRQVMESLAPKVAPPHLRYYQKPLLSKCEQRTCACKRRNKRL